MSAFTEQETAIEYARTKWEDGEIRLQRAARDSTKRERLEAVVDAISYELEKRIGQVFTTLELAALQDRAESWCTAIAHETAPEHPEAWDMDTVQNAAFHRLSRRASDYQMNVGTS